MNRPVFPALILLSAFLSGCIISRKSDVPLPEEIYVHTENRPNNLFLRWEPANPRSFAGSYSGEMGDTVEFARFEVAGSGKRVTIEGKFVTRTPGGGPRETRFEPSKLERDRPLWFEVSGRKVIFVTYMDPQRSVFSRPVNGFIYNGLFYVKDSELEGR